MHLLLAQRSWCWFHWHPGWSFQCWRLHRPNTKTSFPISQSYFSFSFPPTTEWPYFWVPTPLPVFLNLAEANPISMLYKAWWWMKWTSTRMPTVMNKLCWWWRVAQSCWWCDKVPWTREPSWLWVWMKNTARSHLARANQIHHHAESIERREDAG